MKEDSFNSGGTAGILLSSLVTASVVDVVFISVFGFSEASKFPTAKYLEEGLLMGEQVHSHFMLEVVT